MKKLVIVLSIVMLIIVNSKTNNEIIIPNDAIRIRVIASSNTDFDQKIKKDVKETLQQRLNTILKDAKNIEEVREILNNNLKGIDFTVEKILEKNKIEPVFHTTYGLNYFPPKEYKGITYEEGYYESLVVTLGKGEGDNWWCVLFPPLCLMESTEEKIEEVEYKSFIKEILDKYL